MSKSTRAALAQNYLRSALNDLNQAGELLNSAALQERDEGYQRDLVESCTDAKGLARQTKWLLDRVELVSR